MFPAVRRISIQPAGQFAFAVMVGLVPAIHAVQLEKRQRFAHDLAVALTKLLQYLAVLLAKRRG
jgi:hypothetical protein